MSSKWNRFIYGPAPDESGYVPYTTPGIGDEKTGERSSFTKFWYGESPASPNYNYEDLKFWQKGHEDKIAKKAQEYLDEIYPDGKDSAQRHYEAQAEALKKYGLEAFGNRSNPTTTTTKPTTTNTKPTTSKSPTYKPTSYQGETQSEAQEMVARAKQQAKDNLELSISQANDLYLRSTNPYGAEAENMAYYGLGSDGGYKRAFIAQQNANRANNLSQAQNAYKDYIFNAENAKNEMDLSLLMHAMQLEQQDRQFEYQKSISERDYNDYKSQLNLSNWESAYNLGVDAIKNNSSLSSNSLVNMFISRGMSMAEAERLAEMVKNAYGNISI